MIKVGGEGVYLLKWETQGVDMSRGETSGASLFSRGALYGRVGWRSEDERAFLLYR